MELFAETKDTYKNVETVPGFLKLENEKAKTAEITIRPISDNDSIDNESDILIENIQTKEPIKLDIAKEVAVENYNSQPSNIVIEEARQENLKNIQNNFQEIEQPERLKRNSVKQIKEIDNFANVGGDKAPEKSKIMDQTMELFLTKAYQENPEINAARAALKRAHEALPNAYAGFLPQVNYNLSNAYQESGFTGGASNEFYTDTQQLELRQELFGGGETYYAVESALKQIEAAEKDLVAIEQNFFLEAVTAYINAIFTDKVYNLSKKNEDIILDQLESTKQRYVVGDATKTDVAQSESRYANAKAQTILSYNDYIIAKANFRRIFLVDAPNNFDIPSELPEIPETLEKSLKIAFEKNPELQREYAQKLSSAKDVKVSASQLFPQIDMVATTGERESVTGATLFDTEADTIALNVRVPLYNSGRTYTSIREAQDRRREAGYNYENRKNIVRDNVTRAWQQVKTNEINVSLAKQSLVAAQFAVQGIIEEQKQGVRLIQDILDAERERFAAEINYARAIRDSVIAVYNLKNLVGELTAESLDLPIASYDVKEHYENTKFKLFGF